VHKLGVIVPTKDRPDALRVMLRSLAGQSRPPTQVVVVDASAESAEMVVRSFEDELNITYQHHHPPSAAQQRNAGLAALQTDVSLVGVMDDDIVLEPDAVERMLTFWERAGEDVGGTAFNWLNAERRALPGLKRSRLTAWMGLYSARPGGVAPSGWQAIADAVERTIPVEWLSSCAAVWRREMFDRFRFDPFFEGYSYLEDLEFSYTVGRAYRLFVVADAGFRHYPAEGGRIGRFRFGRTEVRNRLYFVKKHGLSVPRCCLGLMIRLGMSLAGAMLHRDRAQLDRALGNMREIAAQFRAAIRTGPIESRRGFSASMPSRE